MRLRHGSANPPSVTVKEEGSLLVEALVGIGMLGALAAAIATLLPAALDASVRARAHHAALMVGDTLLEASVVGLEGTVQLPDLDGVRVTPHVGHVASEPAGALSGCDRSSDPGPPASTIRVQHGGRGEGREVGLHAGAAAAATVGRGARDLTLRWPGEGGLPDEIVIVDPSGAIRHPSVVDGGCSSFRDVPTGTSWVTSAGGAATLIDRVHVSLDDRPHAVTLSSRPHDRTLGLERAATLEVSLDDGGARRPDHVAQGELRWFVRGDEANIGTGIDETRSVHPGMITVVVPGCDDGAATGSTASVEVGPGEHATVDVPLSVVTVENLRGRTDVWLNLQRSTACADGAPLLPELRFEGGLHEGMRIALPRGEWDAWLRRPASRALTPSVRFVAVGTETVVQLP